MRKKLIVILGPTASGKTALALHLASVFDGEIVNADSRQIYKGMDIGTAKLTQLQTTSYQLQAIHLIDVVEPNEEFTVADYKKLAVEIVNDIGCRSKLPILVGGTGLYIKAVVDNLQFPPIPPQKDVRAQLEKKSESELYEMLKTCDPLTARSIDKYNKRRLVRALEVVLATGESFFGQTKKGPKLYETLQIALDFEGSEKQGSDRRAGSYWRSQKGSDRRAGSYIPKGKLFQNIEKRAHQMIKQGLEDEVEDLLKKYGWTNVLLNTIGYKEWKGYFEGKKAREEVISEIIKNTKLLVKKQLTWFRAQKDIHWVKNEKEAESLLSAYLVKDS